MLGITSGILNLAMLCCTFLLSLHKNQCCMFIFDPSDKVYGEKIMNICLYSSTSTLFYTTNFFLYKIQNCQLFDNNKINGCLLMLRYDPTKHLVSLIISREIILSALQFFTEFIMHYWGMAYYKLCT